MRNYKKHEKIQSTWMVFSQEIDLMYLNYQLQVGMYITYFIELTVLNIVS